MPSMDFAYDLIEKLSEESDVDYAILVLRKGGKQDKVDFFTGLKRRVRTL